MAGQIAEVLGRIANGSQAKSGDDDYGLDNFTTAPDACAQMERATGFKMGQRVQKVLDPKEPAYENLHGYFGVIVGTHLFQTQLAAVQLEAHPSQQACYASKNDLRPA